MYMFGKKGKDEVVKKFKKEIWTGIYSYIILNLLKREEMHGYAIRKSFEKLSDGKVVPSEGSLYDLLKKLRKSGIIDSFWVEERGRLRKCYRRTKLGELILKEMREEIKMLKEILEVIE